MRRTLLLAPALVLISCTPAGSISQDPTENPLVVEQYEAELVDHFVNLEIQKDPALNDSEVRNTVNAARASAIERSRSAAAAVESGIMGNFLGIREETKGTALMTGDGLYFGTDFITIPGAELHVYVTDAVDPRDTPVFPDPSAVDLGLLRSPYGAQAYAVPSNVQPTPVTGSGSTVTETPEERRHATVVLYDLALRRFHGFAQLRP